MIFKIPSTPNHSLSSRVPPHPAQTHSGAVVFSWLRGTNFEQMKKASTCYF